MDINQLNQRIAEIQEKYAPRIKDLEARGQSISDDAPKPETAEAIINLDFTVDMKDQDIYFKVPSITIEDRKLSLDLPRFDKDRQHIAFDVPATRMVDIIIGYKPEWHGPFKVVMTPIIISMPEFYMKRTDIYYDIPRVTMERKEFILGIPKITSTEVHWRVKLPQITIKRITVEASKAEEAGKELQADTERFGAEMQAEIQAEVAKLGGNMMGMMADTKNSVSNTFNQALGAVKQAIDDLTAQGCDPIKVPADGGDINLRKTYDELDTQRAVTLQEIDTVVGSA